MFILRRLLLFLFFLVFLNPVYAVIEHGEMKIFAVTTEGEGLSADLILDIESGTGDVWTNAEPLVGTTTQSAAITAVELSKSYSTETESYDFKFKINSNASVVEGPSAGAAMALLVISMLKDRDLPANVSITGTISEEGFVGPVGGVFEKTKEAAEVGIGLFMIPKGESRQTVRIDSTVQSINLLEYGPSELGIKVVEVGTIDDAIDFAFSDIEAIDINAELPDTVPDFIPEPIQYEEYMRPMKILTSNYIKSTKQLLEEARNSLSTTLIDDAELITAMLESINIAEETLQKAEILNDQNYLYSAANYAFLAKVNALMVRDVAANPSILEPNSTVFEMKLDNLYNDIKKLKSDLGEYTPVDYLEWHIAAQQRLGWAEDKVNKLKNVQVIIIGGEQSSTILEDIQDYEFASAWYEVAEDFFELAENSKKRVVPRDVFKDSMDEFIIRTEDRLAVIAEEDVEDIQRRLDAAKREKQEGWYLSSIFNSASSYALVVGEDAVKDKDLNQLYSLLRTKIQQIDANISGSENKFIWANLYLDHAKYYLESADYYYSLDQGASTVNSLKAGISLAYLAEQLFLASEEIHNYYKSIPKDEYIAVTTPVGDLGDKDQDFTTLLIVAYIGMTLVFLMLALTLLANLFHIRLYKKSYSIEEEIRHIKKLQRKIDESFVNGRISEKKHAELVSEYAAEIAELIQMKSRKMEHIYRSDDLRAALSGFGQRLRALRQHYREGLIAKEEFKKREESYKKRIAELKAELKEEQLEMQLEKVDLIKFKKRGKKPAPSKTTLPVKVGTEALTVIKPKAKPKEISKRPVKKKQIKKKTKKAGKAKSKAPKPKPSSKKATKKSK